MLGNQAQSIAALRAEFFAGSDVLTPCGRSPAAQLYQMDSSMAHTHLAFYARSRTSSALYLWATLLFLTAIASALRDPTMTASFLARVTAV